MKKVFMIALVIMVLIVGAVKVYGSWVNCSGPFPGTCTQGGCNSPKEAKGCVLYGCSWGYLTCEEPPPI